MGVLLLVVPALMLQSALNFSFTSIVSSSVSGFKWKGSVNLVDKAIVLSPAKQRRFGNKEETCKTIFPCKILRVRNGGVILRFVDLVVFYGYNIVKVTKTLKALQ